MWRIPNVRLCVLLALIVACSTPEKPGQDAGPVVPEDRVPGAPTEVVGAAGDGQISLAWNAPTDEGTDPIIGYTVTISPSGRTATTHSTSLLVFQLTNGTAYTFTVHATNSVGDGPESQPSAPVTPRTPFTAPGAPTNVVAVGGDRQASLSWTAPTSDGGSPITGYTVTVTPGSTQLTTTSTSAVVTGLQNGRAYSFTVHATNTVGASPESAPSNAVTPSASMTVPDAPTQVTATATNGQATISWTAPAHTGGTEITGYTVTSTPGTLRVSTTGATTATIPGLTNGTAYTFTVHATNAIGSGPESAPSNSVTPATIPGAPVNVVAVAGDGSVTVTWSAPLDNGGAPVGSYDLTLLPTGSTLTTTLTSATLTGLTNGQSYSFAVVARNAVGIGPAATSNTVKPRAAPGAPAHVVAINNEGTITVSWQAPEDDGAAIITGYTVTSTPDGRFQTTSGELSVAFSGLTIGTSHTFTVHATNVAGSGPESSPSNAIIPATLPGAPTGVTATADNASATVSWTAPEDTGGLAINGYVVVVDPGSTYVSADTNSVTITGLTNGTSYSFSVQAVTEVGGGNYSSSSDPVTPLGPPGVPTDVSAVAGDGTVLLAWTPPLDSGGTNITGYVITGVPGDISIAVGAQASFSVIGLTNGTSYTFTVHATNAVGAGPDSPPTNAVTPSAPQSLPGAPVNVAATAASGVATVTWSAPASDGNSPITSYLVTVTPGGATFTTADLSATIANLTNGLTYSFTVRAVNALGAGPESERSNEVTPLGAPGAPTQLAADVGRNTASLSWLAPVDDGGSPILSYTLTLSPGGETFTTIDTRYVLSHLSAEGGPYSITVHATNALGDGPDSAATDLFTPAFVPGAPTNLHGAAGSGQVVLSWTAPTDDGGSSITAYVVTTLPGGATTVVTGTTASITGLNNGERYTFIVHAVNIVGDGPESAPSALMYPGARVPGAPLNIRVGVGYGEALITWDPPADDGGAPIQSYVVQADPGTRTVIVDSTVTQTAVDGLTNGTTYTFTVYAINAVGSGEVSAPSRAVTPGSTPGVPQNVNAVAGNRQVTVSWSAPASTGDAPISSYTVTTTPGGTTTTVTGTSAIISDLQNGVSYTFTVHATTIIGSSRESAQSNAVVPLGPPGPPTIISITPGDRQITVVFAPPTDDGGSPITSYVATASPGGASVTIPAVSNGPSRRGFSSTPTYTVTITGLSNGVTYTATVVAVNAFGAGPSSAPSNSVEPGAVVPGAPTDVVATAGNASATVSWTAPASDGGSPITSYVVTVSPGGATSSVSGATSATISGLSPGTSYSFSVHAINAVGDGPESAASNAVTPTAVATVPGAPTDIIATAGDASATVTWTAPASNGGSAITGYTVTSTPGGIQTTTTGGMSATVTGLTNGTSYTFTVHATNAVGDGAESSPSSPVTPTAPLLVPGAPTNVAITTGIAQATVTWNAPGDNGGSALMSYTVTASPGGFTQTTGLNTATFVELAPFTTYTFSVTATNAFGTGPAATGSATTPAGCYSDASCGPNGICDSSGACVMPCAGSDECHSCPSWNAGGACYCAAGGACLNDECADTSNCTVNNIAHVCDTSTRTCVQCLSDYDCPGEGSGAYCFGNSCGWCGSNSDCSPSRGGPHCEGNGTCGEAVVPFAPTNVQAVAGVGQATVSWTEPGDNGGSPITGYTVTSTPGGLTATTTGATSATIAGLTKGTSYTFTVHAKNAVGVSVESAASNAVTPTATQTVPGQPTNVQATAGDGSATVTWTAPVSDGGSPITGYTVTTVPDGFIATTDGATSATVTGLTNGMSYMFTVHATNAIGDGAESAASNQIYLPDPLTAPTNLTARIGDGAVLLSWDWPIHDPGYSQFRVVGDPGGFNDWVSDPHMIVTGLTNGVSYIFSVQASGSAEPGAWATTGPVVPGRKPGVPAAPLNAVTLVSYSNDWTDPAGQRNIIHWDAPDPGDSPITGYRVENEFGEPLQIVTTTSAEIWCNLCSSTFTVSAINAIGEGPFVVPISHGTPDAPTNLEVWFVNQGLGLSWDAVEGAAYYRASCGEVSVTTTDTTAVVGGLVNGVHYQCTVTAAYEWGEGLPAYTDATPFGPGFPPTNVVAIAHDASAEVSWQWLPDDSAGGLDGFVVTAHPGGMTLELDDGRPYVLFTGLTNGVEYTFTVNALGWAGTTSGESEPSNVVVPNAAVTAPGAPFSVHAAPGNGVATVTWTAPLSDGGSPITGYTVTSNDGQTATTTGATTATVSGLTNGAVYTFTVTATNAVGTSIASAPSYYVIPFTTPDAPTDVIATPGNMQAKVTWTAPAFNGGNSIDGYTITASPGGRTTWTTQTYGWVTGLTNGTTYTFTVHATNYVAGHSPESQPSSGVTPNTVPAKPTNVLATAGNGQVTVTWTAPTNQGTPITGYTVTCSGGQTATTTGATSATITGLTNGSSYTFTVHATNAMGDSPESTPTAAVTPSTVPDAPTNVTATAGNNSATVSWVAPVNDGGKPILGYSVIASPGSYIATTTRATTATVTGLPNGTSYVFSVIARNATGTGPAALSSPVIPGNTVPGAPTNVQATPSSGSVSVTWSAPASDGGRIITLYTVTSSPGGVTATTSGTSAVVVGLSPSTSYTFTVHATNALGDGPESTPSAAVTTLAVPDAPTNVTATAGNASVTVSWTPPANDGGRPITNYRVMRNDAPAGFLVSASLTHVTISGLVNGTSYTFWVSAINANGTGPSSTVSNVATPGPTAPGAPQSVTVTPGAGKATVSWTAPFDNGGSPLTGYRITVSPGEIIRTTTFTSLVFTGLAPATTYTVTVAATNAVGTGPAVTGSATTLATVPGAPTNVQATAGDASATVTWTAPVNNGGSTITGYTVTATPGGATASVSGGTTATVTGLTNGTSYTFTVHATNATGNSPESAPSAAVTPTACSCGDGLFCNEEGSCVQCLQDSDCGRDPWWSGPMFCTDGVCSQCRGQSDCDAQGQGYSCGTEGSDPYPLYCLCTLGDPSVCGCQGEICYNSGSLECVEPGTCGGN